MRRDNDGLGMIEVIVSMLLLAVLAVALLPGLWQGVVYSSKQSSTATATRFLNALIEEARALQECTTIPGVIGRTTTDGEGTTLTSVGSLNGCAPGAAATLTLSITAGGDTLANTTARIFVP